MNLLQDSVGHMHSQKQLCIDYSHYEIVYFKVCRLSVNHLIPYQRTFIAHIFLLNDY